MSANASVHGMRWWLCVRVLLAAVWVASELALAAPLRVRGAPEFQSVRSTARPNGAKLTGTLRDETRRPLAGQRVALFAPGAPGAKVSGCDTAEPSVVTDEAGRFCFVIEGPLPDRARLQYEGSDFYVRAERDVQIELNPAPVSFAINVGAATWESDGPPRRVEVALQQQDPNDHAQHEEYEVRLALLRAGEPERPLPGMAVLQPPESAEFDVDPAQLGAPGPLSLIAIIGDDPAEPLARVSTALLLRAQVTLSWGAHPTEVRPELGFDIGVIASAPGLRVSDGSIELISGRKLLDARPVHDGSVSLRARFLAPPGESVALLARYVPEHPWLDPGEPLQLELPLARLSPWLHAPWVILVALAAAWIFRAWRRPGRHRPKQPPERLAVPKAPHATVIETPAGHLGWSGTVRDLHTWAPIPNVRLMIMQPSVSGAAIVREAISDAAGRFSLEPVAALPEGARLVASAAEHSTLSQAVPPQGRLEVGLSSRRRSLLAHLLEWAEARGLSEPPINATPSEIASRARAQHNPSADWVLDIERAVFDHDSPSAQREEQLVSASPARDQSIRLKR